MTEEELKASFALYDAAKGILNLIDIIEVDRGSAQQDRVYAQFEFDDLRAAVEGMEKLKGCGQSNEIEDQEGA